MIAVFAARVALVARAKSATFDEPFHIALGCSVLVHGDYRLRDNKPVLSQSLLAAPLVFSDLIFPGGYEPWRKDFLYPFSLEFLYRNVLPARTLLFRARLMSLLAALLMAGLVFEAARYVGGESAGLAALLLLTMDPNMLAHAGLATEDMTVTAFSFAALFALELYRARPGSARAAAYGLAAAAAVMSKFSALYLAPASAVLLILDGAWRPRWWKGRRPHAAAAAGAAVLAFFAVYGRHAAEYWRGFIQNAAFMAGGQPAFFAGHYSGRGFWSYFLGAVALKTQLPTLFLAGAAFVSGVSYRDPRRRWLLLPVLLLLGVSAFSPQQIGLRYILPIYPFVFVLAGISAAALRPRFAVAALLAWAAVSSIAIHPDYLAYFNELAGGPDGGWRYLVDSNLDWGQDLGGLRDYVRDHGVSDVVLSYYGCAPSESTGFPFQELYSTRLWGAVDHLNSDAPVREILAVSATNLQGVYSSPAFGGNPFAWLKPRAPLARIGHSIFVYDATSDPRLHEWLAHVYLIGAHWPQARREIRRARLLDPSSGWAALLASFAARSPDEMTLRFDEAVRLGCEKTAPWPEALATTRARIWYAALLKPRRAEFLKRGRGDLAAAAARLLARPELAGR
ncbi:MAG: glycosyltransferase family 39 protein [Elusimicrobiota bacterium]